MRCVRGGSHSDVSVGCSERPLSEISQRGCAGGPHVGTVWVSVWRLLVRGPEMLVGKPQAKVTDPLIHAYGSVTLLLHLGRKAHVHAPTGDED